MADRAEKMDETAIKALVAEEIRSASNYTDSEMSPKRVTALEYIRGEMNDLPSLEGRSKVVSRDVADTISWIVPGIIRVFDASDRMAIYEPEHPNDEEGAKQATDYINYIFRKDNPGYRILWDATQDALGLGNGIVKHYWDETETCEYSEHTGMSEEQVALLLQEDGVSVTAQSPGEPQQIIQAGPDGQPMQVDIETFDIKVKRVDKSGKLVVECIEPENFLMDSNARTIEEARFTAHRDPNMTRSNLIKMGFDKEVVDNLPAYQNSIRSQEDTSRDTREMFRTNDVGAESETLVELYECYVKCDVDGDGESETVRAYYAGNGGAGELLDWEVWDDDVPFSDIPCEPVAHRWDARSVTDKTMDLQKVNSVLLRNFLDNTYATGNPQREAEEGSILNPEQLTAPKFNGTIWRKKGSLPIVPHVIPYIGDKLLMALEYMGQVLEKRTGVSRASMALDPETLQNQSATANQNQKDASYSQIELIARNMAELGWTRVFKQMLRLIVKHQDRPRVIRLRDKWVEMDPRHWNANMDVTINVGLGTGSRDRDLAMLNNVLATQMGLLERFAGQGLAEQALDMLQRVMKTAQKQAESSGLKNPDEYYPTIGPEDMQKMAATIEEKAQQPTPEMLELQVETQAKAQVEAAKAQAKLQTDAVQAQADAQTEALKAKVDEFRETIQARADIAVEDNKRRTEEYLAKLEEQYKSWTLSKEQVFEAEQKRLDREHDIKLENMKIAAAEKSQNEKIAADGEARKADGKHKTNEALIKAGKNPGVDPDDILAVLKAPKKRTVERDANGRIASWTEEAVQ